MSAPSKLPGTSYGLPAKACIAGAKLAKIAGTVCSTCYALKSGGRGFYARGNVVKAHARRLASLTHPLWVDAMVRVLAHMHSKPLIRVDLGLKRRSVGKDTRTQWNESGHHRWHDVGDIQSIAHIARICQVAARTPKIRHWMPTQELTMVRAFVESGGAIPANLVVRVSGIRIDGAERRAWPHTSSVFSSSPPPDAHVCPAPSQDHRCGSCRACWSPEVAHVAYALH